MRFSSCVKTRCAGQSPACRWADLLKRPLHYPMVIVPQERIMRHWRGVHAPLARVLDEDDERELRTVRRREPNEERVGPLVVLDLGRPRLPGDRDRQVVELV